MRTRVRDSVVRWVAVAGVTLGCVCAQTNPNERMFPQSKTVVEEALKNLQASMSGRLPVLEGFAKAGLHSLDHYQRGYFQTTVQVLRTTSGGSLVRVTTKVTAWYADPDASHSGYELLTSNGRIEADLLDQLADQLSTTAGAREASSNSEPPAKPIKQAEEPGISAPAPSFPETGRTFSSSVSEGLAERVKTGDGAPQKPHVDQPMSAIEAETRSLEDILKNQAHPKNLVAVKKSGTPVVGSPSLTAKPLFLASLHDEFELLNFNADWVHVRISGLSRGWIWRNSVEMPEGIPDTEAPSANAQPTATDLYHVVREETAQFPGDWEPLKGKNVKIVSVQQTDESAKEAGPKQRLEFVKFLLEKNYAELAQRSVEMAGIVVIFDSADGGMIAATLPALEQWRAGKLSDSALWHKCFFDPPETFDSAGSSASQ